MTKLFFKYIKNQSNKKVLNICFTINFIYNFFLYIKMLTEYYQKT